MSFVSLIYNGRRYEYNESSDVKMSIIGLFFTSNVSWGSLSYRDWAVNDLELYTSGNVTELYKEGGKIIMTDLYSQEEVPSEVVMTKQQFIQLFDDWNEKVFKLQPKEVVIRCENGQYNIETKM